MAVLRKTPNKSLEAMATSAAPGLRNIGEKSSAQVAEIMFQAGCFVLPSRVDHWPLVIHEAASAGLPILASSMCGSAVELVQSGFNGYVFPVNNESILSRLLLFMDESGLGREMGKNSLQIALRYSPELWVRRILQDIPLIVRGHPVQKMMSNTNEFVVENSHEDSIRGG